MSGLQAASKHLLALGFPALLLRLLQKARRMKALLAQRFCDSRLPLMPILPTGQGLEALSQLYLPTSFLAWALTGPLMVLRRASSCGTHGWLRAFST